MRDAAAIRPVLLRLHGVDRAARAIGQELQQCVLVLGKAPRPDRSFVSRNPAAPTRVRLFHRLRACAAFAQVRNLAGNLQAGVIAVGMEDTGGKGMHHGSKCDVRMLA